MWAPRAAHASPPVPGSLGFPFAGGGFLSHPSVLISAASPAARGPRSPSLRRGAAPGGLAELGRGGPGAGGAGVIGMMRTQCLLGLRTFVAFAAKLWSFFIYLLRRQIRTETLAIMKGYLECRDCLDEPKHLWVLSLKLFSKVIQYQTVRYDILPLSPLSRNRLAQVKRKILVLDLDETLIHSHHDGVLRPTVRPGTPPDFILKVVIDKHPVRFFVHKRPHVDFFLEVVSQWYELVVFTASMEIYGSAVADKLDNSRSILKRRYYRQHCTLELGSYIKDLSVVHSDLSSIVILDNSPGAYRSHPGMGKDNAIPIKSWFSDPSDTALLNLLPMLDALRFTADVRSVLSRNLHQHRLW
eukprot:XP_006246705.1 PREDICTED: CTD nuclear envelope phosphatase 1 isoform X3 [Rattus norvegicus]